MLKKIMLFSLIIILMAVSFVLIDRPVVTFMAEHHSRAIWIFPKLANVIPDLIMAFVALLYLYVGMRGTKIGHTCRQLLWVGNACVITGFLKEVLKGLFARSWADTFICNNPSYLQNHDYGFHWYKFQQIYASFPSGHTALTAAFAVSLSFVYPAWRWLWMLLIGLVALGQIVSYYHYVSDVIAGLALGYWVAWLNQRLIR